MYRQALTFAFAALFGFASVAAAGPGRRFPKLDDELNRRAAAAPASDITSVIVRMRGNQLPAEFRKFARPAPVADGFVLDVPNALLKAIAQHGNTLFASYNGLVHAFNFRTGIQSGAFFARRMLGFTGEGVGVAVLDSGIAPVDDLSTPRGRNDGRVYFQDFVDRSFDPSGGCVRPCDYNGHGTHVAGTIAGDGFDSLGQQAGMAPRASIYALRVLGQNGSGQLSDVLRALDWVRVNARAYNIRVVNLSFGMAPKGTLPGTSTLAALLAEDDLARATKALVDAGVFVVAAAGNLGQVACAALPHAPAAAAGECDVWGGITAPGSYPWVFTAGAASSMGSYTRSDDTRAPFSSRGPAFPLQLAKPDLLAGGVGIESAAAPNSLLYNNALALHPEFLRHGVIPTAAYPYLVLSGTSQASAVVSGVAALMLQANPRLTPNLIKAILEYTSQDYGYNPLEEGAGILNALGAVRLARFYATARRGQRVPVEPIWSRHFIWGNHEMSGGLMLPGANAWTAGVLWGAPRANGDSGDNIVWGTSCGAASCGEAIVWGASSDGDNIVWGTADGDNIVWGTAGDGDNIVWGTSRDGDNIVWGSDCGGADCSGERIVWGSSGDNIVWGTAHDGDNIVWGTDDGDNIVWGTNAGDNIVWGTADGDNIVWGTSDGDNIVWGTDLGDNIVWGTDGDNITWGTDHENLGGGRPGVRPVTEEQYYRLFLNRSFDVWWVMTEFGDGFLSSDGRAVPEPPRPPRVRRRR